MLECISRPVAAVQSRQRERFRSGVALVVQVMNRVDRSCIAKRRAAAQSGMQIYRQERGMPVVRMHHIRFDAQKLTAVDDGAAEERVPMQEVVDSVMPRIDMRAIEEIVVLDEDQRYITAG